MQEFTIFLIDVTHTFDALVLVMQHPQRADLYQAIATDLPEPRIIPAFSSQFLPATRLHQILALPKDYRIVTVPEVCDAPPPRLYAWAIW